MMKLIKKKTDHRFGPVIFLLLLNALVLMSTGSGVNAQGPRGSGLDGSSFNPGSSQVQPVSDALSGSRNRDESERDLIVLDVRILGNETVSKDKISARLKTRPDRYYDPVSLHSDAREIMSMKSFRDVKTYLQKNEKGVIVTFQVFERPVIREVQYLGNRGISDKTLGKNSGLAVGDPLDLYSVRLAKNRLEEYYKGKGFLGTEVEILEGNKPEHRNVVFMVHEQERQRIWHVDFVGNEMASDERLRKAVIKSKPGFLKHFFGGEVVKTEIDADQKRLEAYYKNLGFFSVQVQREEEYDDAHRWLTIRWVINEGPRYQVQNVSFSGNEQYETGQLDSLMTLKQGDFFDASKMGLDVNSLQDLYGSQGYVFANIEAEPRFLEEQGKLNLVYRVTEGEQYRVGQIKIRIGGELGNTKQSVVLNRISLRPGDVIDIRKIRNSERRLTSSGLFIGNPTKGEVPKIEVKVPDPSSLERLANQQTSTFRGQSPDSNVRTLDLNILTPQLR